MVGLALCQLRIQLQGTAKGLADDVASLRASRPVWDVDVPLASPFPLRKHAPIVEDDGATCPDNVSGEFPDSFSGECPDSASG